MVTRGEQVFAGLIGLVGLGWVVQSFRYAYWSGFAPGAGFLPMWIGVVLAGLVVLFLLTHRRTRMADADATTLGGALRIGRVGPLEFDQRAQRANRLELVGVGPMRHQDPGPAAQPGSGIGHRGAVISGRSGDHPATELTRVEREELAEGPSGLEGPGVLAVLELEDGAERGIDDRGLDDPRPDPCFGVEDRALEVNHR